MGVAITTVQFINKRFLWLYVGIQQLNKAVRVNQQNGQIRTTEEKN